MLLYTLRYAMLLQFGILPLHYSDCSLRTCCCSRAEGCAYMQFENLPLQPGSTQNYPAIFYLLGHFPLPSRKYPNTKKAFFAVGIFPVPRNKCLDISYWSCFLWGLQKPLVAFATRDFFRPHSWKQCFFTLLSPHSNTTLLPCCLGPTVLQIKRSRSYQISGRVANLTRPEIIDQNYIY
jgi:hypothetical protein